jgi:hypothetical protein
MVEILRYNEYNLNESFIDDTYATEEKKSLLLFSNSIRKDYNINGGKFEIFYPFYNEKHNNNFFGLKRIYFTQEIKLINDPTRYRFTNLSSNSYKDTEEISQEFNLPYIDEFDKKSVKYFFDNYKNYIWYKLVKGDKDVNNVPIRDSASDYLINGRKWFFMIEKDKVCNLVKIKSRAESGKRFERETAKLFGWEEDSHDIEMVIKSSDIKLRANGLMEQIFKIQTLDNGDTFTIQDDFSTLSTFSKNDLIIDKKYKIELKKLSKKREGDLWNGKPVGFMLAEQCKMSSRSTLRNIVRWFTEVHKNDTDQINVIRANKLLELKNRSLADEFRNKLKGKKKKFDKWDICDIIRNEYNKQNGRLLNKLNEIPQERWMSQTYGIYFGWETDRRYNFIIKTNDGIKYQWEFVNEWLGFKRLKLFIYISGNAWEYIHVEGNKFVKTYQLKDYKKYEIQKGIGILRLKRFYGTDIYKFDQKKGLWIKYKTKIFKYL